MTWHRWLFTLVLALLIAACARYPLGMTEAEWQRLTPQQQYDARLQQADIDRQEAAARAAEAEARRLAEQRRRAEEERLFASRYRHPFACELTGDANFPGDLIADEIEPVYFRIGERQSASLLLEQRIGPDRRPMLATLNSFGDRLDLCAFVGPDGDERCERIRFWNRDLRAGIVRERAWIPDIFDGTLTCRPLSAY